MLMYSMDDNADQWDSSGDAKNGAHGVSLFDATNQYFLENINEHNVGTTNTASFIDDQVVKGHDHQQSATFTGTFTSFDTNGWTWNFSAANGTSRKWPYFAIEEVTAPTPTGYAPFFIFHERMSR
jgi:hypothetical protein